jgi:CelD/BcsL family acetyltransferase involved in cellulose biosynthesis
MQFHILDPLLDSRWDDFVASHPRASVFHRGSWIRALASTYGYRPLVLTSTPPVEPLSDGIPFCEIRSWITGSRLVSLPFADHADPLLNERGDLSCLVEWIRLASLQHSWRYVELRPLLWPDQPNGSLAAGQSFWSHFLDLTPPLEQIFRKFHRSCIQRRILHAERSRLVYEKGRSEEVLSDFYRLLMMTRRRHNLLPQPRAWFRNLVRSMGGDAEVRLVRQDGVAVAAILTLRHQRTAVYKYGCSDQNFHRLAGMPFLFWKLIQESKADGVEQIDFGRTDMENHGLTEFKDRLGATRRRIRYLRFPDSFRESRLLTSKLPAAGAVFSVMPDAISSRMGQLIYRHVG